MPSREVLITWSIRLLNAACLAALVWRFDRGLPRVLQASDTGWLVKTGAWIIENGRLPAHDIFSWTCGHRWWCLYQWLFEVASGAAYMGGGLWLVGLAASVFLALTVIFALPAWWMRAGIKPWLAFICLAALLSPYWHFARPQIASHALFAALLFSLESFRLSGRRRWLVAVLAIMVVWANTHLYWWLGILAVAAYAIHFAADSLRQGKATAGLKATAALLPLSACAVTVNPYGWHLIEYALTFTRDPDYARIHELQPIFSSQFVSPLPVLIFSAAALAVLIWRRSRVPLAGLILACLIVPAGILVSRLSPLILLAFWPYLACALASGKGAPGLPGRRALTALALVAVLAGAGLWCLRYSKPQDVWLSHYPPMRPVLSFMQNHKLGQRIFNSASVGSNMILAGLTPVFIDTRFDFYGKDFCDRWQDCMLARPGWQDYLSRWRVDHLVVQTSEPIHRMLLASPDWLLVYDDGAVSAWVKDRPDGRRIQSELLRGANLPAVAFAKGKHRHFAEKYLSAGRTLLNRGDCAPALAQFHRCLSLAPGLPEWATGIGEARGKHGGKRRK